MAKLITKPLILSLAKVCAVICTSRRLLLIMFLARQCKLSVQAVIDYSSEATCIVGILKSII